MGVELAGRAWAAGARGDLSAPFGIDVDSSIHETYGLQKEGATAFSYTKVRGYHPLYATAADNGEVLAARLRGGNANTGRGAARFLRDVFKTVRRNAVTGPIHLRGDSGFYIKDVVEECLN